MRPPKPSAGEIVVAVDRHSVAAGDDAWSHRQWWVFPAHIRVDDLLLAVLESRCWASVAGGATWIVELRGNHPTIELAAILDGHRSEDTRVLPLLPRGGSRPLADLRRGGHAQLTCTCATWSTRGSGPFARRRSGGP